MANSNDSKPGRGGRREGAGRKSEPGNENSKKYFFRAGGEIGRYLDELKHKTEFIKECLREAIAHQPKTPTQLGDVVAAQGISVVKMPMYDVEVACGMPLDVNNGEQGEMVDLLSTVCPHPEHCYMIRAKGESMRDVNIHTGDIVVVDRSIREPAEDDVAVCELNGEYTLKHVVRREDGCWLVPENKEFHDIPVREGDTLNVWGVVRTVIHNL